MNARLIPLLERLTLFKGLTQKQLARIAAICTIERYQPQEIIFQEGAEGNRLYIVYIGAVDIQLLTRGSDGQLRRSTINTMYPGQMFGEVALLEGSTHTATAIAAQPCSLLVISGPELVLLCERNTDIGYRIFMNLAGDLASKLRTSTLLLGGPIKWQDGELGTS